MTRQADLLKAAREAQDWFLQQELQKQFLTSSCAVLQEKYAKGAKLGALEKDELFDEINKHATAWGQTKVRGKEGIKASAFFVNDVVRHLHGDVQEKDYLVELRLD